MTNLNWINESLVSSQWFNFQKLPVLVFCIITITFILISVRRASLGKPIYIRPFAGIKAIEDAIGRAAEMGKPIIYSTGLGLVSDVSTLASLSLLNKVSEHSAECGSRLIIPNADPTVYTLTNKIVRETYANAGRAQLFHDEDVFFLSNRQYAYAAGVAGLMAREKPGACFFLGKFMAEALILGESGSMTGAIQIAGTDSVSQIPFFLATCDYTLIGEELYAAGAVISKNQKLLGSIKGQDYIKLTLMILLVVLIILRLSGFEQLANLLGGK